LIDSTCLVLCWFSQPFTELAEYHGLPNGEISRERLFSEKLMSKIEETREPRE